MAYHVDKNGPYLRISKLLLSQKAPATFFLTILLLLPSSSNSSNGTKPSFVSVTQNGTGTGNIIEPPTPTKATMPELPPAFNTLTTTSINIIIAYSLLFIIGSVGNISVLFIISRRKLGKLLKWRITILILHLASADLIVICIVIPSEIIWRITIQWFGGNLLCKLCQFGRAFGLYLSSMIIICISIDRFYAILFPLKMVNASKRVKIMLILAWISAAIFAFPQVIVFSVQRHPKYPSFQQCVTYGFLTSELHERIYNIFSLSVMYFIPLTVIFITYSMILCKIIKKSNQHNNSQQQQQQWRQTTSSISRKGNPIKTFGVDCFGKNSNEMNSNEIKPSTVVGFIPGTSHSTNNNGTIKYPMTGHMKRNSFLNRTTLNSSTSNMNGNYCNTNEAAVLMMAKAKWKILRLTCLIVIIFLLCWTPYVVMLLWYIIDRDSARKVPIGIQDSLFMMAVANSCVNPFVYGNYTKNSKQSSSSNNNSNKNRRASRRRHNSISKRKAISVKRHLKPTNSNCRSCSQQNSQSIRLRNPAASLKSIKAGGPSSNHSVPATPIGSLTAAASVLLATREQQPPSVYSSSINCCCYSSKSFVPKTDLEESPDTPVHVFLRPSDRRTRSTVCTTSVPAVEDDYKDAESTNESNSYEEENDFDCHSMHDCDNSSSCHHQQAPKLIFSTRQKLQSQSPYSSSRSSCDKVLDIPSSTTTNAGTRGIGTCNHFPVTSVI